MATHFHSLTLSGRTFRVGFDETLGLKISQYDFEAEMIAGILGEEDGSWHVLKVFSLLLEEHKTLYMFDKLLSDFRAERCSHPDQIKPEIASNSNSPLFLALASFSPSHEIQTKVAFNRNTHSLTLRRLVKLSIDTKSLTPLRKMQKMFGILAESATHPNTPASLRNILLDYAIRHNLDSLLSRCLCHPCTTPQELLKYSVHPNPSVRREVCANPLTPSDVVRHLSRDPDSFVRAGIAFNPNAPHDVLVKIAKGSDRATQEELVNSPYISNDILRLLTWNADYDLRYCIALQASIKELPIDIEMMLIKEDDPEVSYQIANTSAHLEVLKELSYSSYERIVSAVYFNPNTPRELTEELKKELHPEFYDDMELL